MYQYDSINHEKFYLPSDDVDGVLAGRGRHVGETVAGEGVAAEGVLFC